MTKHLIAINANVEQNGFGDRNTRLKVWRRLRPHRPAVVRRQETPRAAGHAKAVMRTPRSGWGSATCSRT
ncbi:hypothetical protein [Streptomyces sp. NPDC045470]|uniref:hypothetical protein n=1 Tax=Streptomyces sp. NPDC045470 TaxID=3155469 RepID=UPI0033D86E25